jgi:uncharacterized membrane protein YqjE
MKHISSTHSTAKGTNRWHQLCFGVVAMMAISSPQYVWALFTADLKTALGATLAQVQGKRNFSTV